MVIVAKDKKAVDSSALLDESKKAASDKKHSHKQRVKASFLDIAPVVDISNNEFFEMASGEFLEIIQIESKDIYSLNSSDLYNDIDNFSNLYISVPEALKILPLNMPMQLEEQKRHILKKIKYTNNPLHKKYLEKRMREFELIEKKRTNHEYFLFIYHKDEMNLKKAVNQIKNKLARSNPGISLNLNKKISILFQISNPCTKPIVD